MILLRDLTDFPHELRSGAISIGNFDGVHLGHARIVERLLAKSRRVGGAAIVFTFDPHPGQVLRRAEPPPPLSSTARKVELLADLGVDAVIAYRTDEAFLKRVSRCGNPYGDGRAAERIVRLLKSIDISDRVIQKRITY